MGEDNNVNGLVRMKGLCRELENEWNGKRGNRNSDWAVKR